MGLGGNSDIQPTAVNNVLRKLGWIILERLEESGIHTTQPGNINSKYTNYITYIIVINFWV